MNQQMLLLKATAYLVVQKDVKRNKKSFTSSLMHSCVWGSGESHGQHRDRWKQQEGFTQSLAQRVTPPVYGILNIQEILKTRKPK